MSADFLANSGVRRRRRGYQPMSEINVTPFVDVMLVLLIVFMITAPLLTAGVPVDLPESQAEALDAEVEPITISVTQSGNVYVQDIEIELAQLGEKLFAIGDSNRDVQIYVRGDRAATYQDIVRVIGHIKASGFNRIGLVALDGSE